MRYLDEDINSTKRARRRNRMTKEELETYYNVTKKSAHTFKNKAKFDRKKSRQEKQHRAYFDFD